MRTRALLAAVTSCLMFCVVGCGGDSGEPVEPEGPLSVADARAVSSGTEVSVEGFVLFDGAGLRLCEALAESFPPQCGGASVVVEGIEVAEINGTKEAQSVVWTESFVVLAGTLEDDVLVVAGATTAGARTDLTARVEVAATTGNFGLKSGDPIPGALVELRSTSMTLDDPPLAEERTDQAGEAVLAAPAAGSYMLFATAETDDPLCFWAAGPTDVDLPASGEVVVVEAFLVCE